MEALTLALIAAGLAVGATGTWSPCGLSMIDSIGPAGHPYGRRTTIAACATFLPAALAGGAITFGALGALGALLHGGGAPGALAAAAAVALAAAVAEARGLRIVPQVRRQLPESWRRVAPLPLAAGGYGVLLGLGFTTFVLSYGVWALMGIALALGSPGAGLAIGLAFGLGRALPIVALAPVADRSPGSRACEAMTMDPRVYRGARAGDALALALVGALLVGGSAATAQRGEALRGSDPSARGAALVFDHRDGSPVLVRGGARTRLPGRAGAIGGPYIATLQGQRIVIRDHRSLEALGSVGARRADALAVSGRFVVHRARRSGDDALIARSIADPARPGRAFRVAAARGPAQLSRPAVEGDLLVWARQQATDNRLVRARLAPRGAGDERVMVASREHAIAGPSLAGGRVVYALAGRRGQQLRVKGLGRGPGRPIASTRGHGPVLWTTAVGARHVHVTELGRGGAATIRSIGR